MELLDKIKSALTNVKENLGMSNWFTGFKDKATGVFGKIKDKFGKAFDSLKGEGSKWEKIKGFFKSLFGDVEKVENEETQKKTEVATQTGAVLKTVPTDSATKAIVPALSEKDQNGNAVEAPPIVGEVVGVAYQTAQNLDTDRKNKGKAKDGETMGTLATIADKMKPDADSKAPSLSVGEKKIALSYGSKLIVALKGKYPTETAFKKALEDFDKGTEKAPVGLHSFRTDTFGNLFEGDMSSVFEPLLGKLDMAEKLKIITSLPSLKEGQVSDDIIKIFKKVLPNTSESQISALAKTVGQISSNKSPGSSFPTNEQLTNIVFSVDNRDLENLSNLFA